MEIREVAHAKSVSLMPSESEWAMLKEQAAMLVKTGLLPKSIDTPEKAIAIALKGRELGIPPMQAFSHIHIVDGKPGSSAELMLALIYRNCPRAIVDYMESSDKICRVRATRPGHKPTEFSFTIEEAQRAGLLAKNNWRNFPGAMLRARAISMVSRAVFPDAISGCGPTPEELGAEVNEDGEVIEAAPIAPASAVVNPGAPEAAGEGRMAIGTKIMNAAKALKLTKEELNDWVKECAGVATTEMSIEQMKDFLNQLEREMAMKGIAS